VASDGTNFLVVDSVAQSDFPGSISAELVGPDGSPIHSVAISMTTSPDTQPVAAYDPASGDYLVAWGQGGDIYGQRVSAAGAALDGATGFVISNATDVQAQPSIAFNGTDFVVVWSDHRSGTFYDIYGTRVDGTGTVLNGGPGGGVLLSPAGVTNKQSPAVAFDGAFPVVAWTQGGGAVVASTVEPDLSAVLDSTPLTAGALGGRPTALASDGAGRTLIGYTIYSTVTNAPLTSPENAQRVRLRLLLTDVAPTTTITLNPASPNGNNLWYKGPTGPTFTLNATDTGGSGVVTTYYKIDGGATQTYTGTPVSIPDGSAQTVSYWSVDRFGGVIETMHTTSAIKVDTVAPVTTIALNPVSPNGNNLWYKGPTGPTFTLNATDTGGSGVVTTYYKIDGGATQTYTGTPVSIPDGSAQTVSYWSVDTAGNTETTNTTSSLMVDTVSPVIHGLSNVTTDASGPAEATVSYTLPTATDTGGSGVSGSVSCSPLSGTPFAIGTTTVSCTVSDLAGNTSTGSFTVHVNGGAEQVANLLTQVKNAAPGTALVDKLTQVQADIKANDKAAACSALTDLIGLVKAQSGKKLTAAQAASFTAQATQIQAVLGC
jgi:hypothetical protein